MPVIVVANPKGGVGKSTLATNLAGALAHRGKAVMLGDTDPQQSARHWLSLRDPSLPTIRGWDIDDAHHVRVPKGVTHIVLDSPAGLHGKRLDQLMKHASHVLVPLQPSLFDIQATHEFIRSLRAHPRGAKVAIGVVGNRVREHTISNDQLHHFLASQQVPVLGYLRDAQIYVQLAAHGMTLWDTAPSRVERDVAQWQPILGWVR